MLINKLSYAPHGTGEETRTLTVQFLRLLPPTNWATPVYVARLGR